MPDHAAPIPCIPPEAPFSAPQRAWLNGFLAGLFSSAPAAHTAATPAGRERVTVIFGSQSGNAEKLAYGFAKSLKQAGFEASVAGMEKYACAALTQEKVLLVVTSTHGEGDPPDNAQALHRELHAAEDLRLDGLRYAVLALGDRNYEKFCQCGVDFDQRLEQLGARRLCPRIDADVDYEEPAARWQAAVLAALQSSPSPNGSSAGDVSVTLPAAQPAATAARPHTPVAATARLVECRNLHTGASEKETRHVAFTFEGEALPYTPGDALEIAPENCPELVELALQASGFPGDAPVTVPRVGTMKLREALSRHCQVSKVTTAMVKTWAEKTAAPSLRHLCDPARTADLQNFLRGRDVVDLLADHRGALRQPQELVDLLPRLAPRLYSIASSPKAHPGEVHLTVGVVRYHAHGRLRKGVCSTFLAERVAPGTSLAVRVHVNTRFRLPADASAPLILIGPGTGIAPFRAFLEERQALGASGKNWLFFGNPYVASDFLYRDELAAWKQSGLLTRLDTAFSRDQSEKIYVQHRLCEHGALLWSWLQDGAHVYVCGDAARMAKDVEAALLDLIAQELQSPEAARQHLETLRQNGRYQRDVY